MLNLSLKTLFYGVDLAGTAIRCCASLYCVLFSPLLDFVLVVFSIFLIIRTFYQVYLEKKYECYSYVVFIKIL